MDTNDDASTGLALSGGGFRATLFHLGALWRLNEMAILSEIGRFSSVSGGSILAGLVAVRWPKLIFNEGIATNFQDEIVGPIWNFCSRNIERAAVLFGIISGTWKLEHSYQKHLVGTAGLQDIPDHPEFIFNAAHIETGRNFILSKRKLHTWRIGDINSPNLPLTKAMAASSAFPPAFPPVILKLEPSSFKKSEHADLFHREDLKKTISLTDGGAYDNLGIHAIQNCRTILVSDGSGPLKATHGKWYARQFNHRIMRPMETALEQTRAIRRQAIIGRFQKKEKNGALWMAATPLTRYTIPIPFSVSPGWNEYLSLVRTRLNPFTDAEKSMMVNWGYLLCDLSVREHYRTDEPPPNELPFPEFHFSNPPAEIR